MDNREVLTQKADYAISQIDELNRDGDLQTDPDYQREYVYTDKQASLLVESVLMNIPIPTVYWSESSDEDGHYEVIDGQQRIVSLIKFFNNEFRLTGLRDLTELNGLLYKELDKSFRSAYKKYTLSVIIIKKQSELLKYEVFSRLNQGSVKLNAQELRNCIFRGSFNKMLDELSENKELRGLFQKPNYRKSYQELILRFFALQDFMNFRNSITKQMNTYMQEHKNDDEASISSLSAKFSSTMRLISSILGDKAFFDENGKFSRTIFDSVVIPFSLFSSHDLMPYANEIRSEINQLKRNEDYKGYSTANTGSRKSVVGRILMVYQILLNITGSFGNDDLKRVFSDDTKKKLFHKGYICSYCGNEIQRIEDAEVDHVLAFSKGGKTDISNAQLLHIHCNRAKSDKVNMVFDSDDEDMLDE